jgi:hypothetical protein
MVDKQQLEDSEKALKKVIRSANTVLAEASTINPIQKTCLILSRTKLVAENRSPFNVASVMSVRVEDVLNANATLGPFFGTVIITAKQTGDNPHSFGLFWRKDAINLKRTIQGYVIALQQNIDLNALPADELKAMLYELGTDDHSIK